MTTTSTNDAQPRAQTALASSPIYDIRDLQVEHSGRRLLISGTVSSFYHKQLAQEIVRSVCKGIEVINSIRVTEQERSGIRRPVGDMDVPR